MSPGPRDQSRLDDDLSEVRLRRLVELVETTIEGAPDNAGLDLLRVAKGASLVDLLVRQAEVGDGRSIVPLGNIAHTVAARRLNLSPLLRRIVLVREPALRIRLDLKRIGLGTVRSRDQISRCKEIYEALHPETADGGVTGGRGWDA